MKILLIYDYLSEVGGVERVMATHARWLTKAGYDVSLIFNYVNNETRKYEFLKDLDIKESGTLKTNNEAVKVFSALLGLNNLKQEKADLVICYSFPSLFTSRKIIGKKAFFYLPMEFVYFPLKKRWEWANDMKRKIAFFGSLFLSPVLKKIDKKLIKNKLVIANSEFTRREIIERYKQESFVSYPPLNKIFKPETIGIEKILKKYDIKKRFILTAGRIVPDKRTDWLIEIFSEIKEDLNFVIAGGIDDKHKKELEELAIKLGVKDKVKILGLIEQRELVKLYSCCENFLFASPKEAFGLVPIEAMACSAPVIAWNDNAGPNEYVINNINGYLAKPYDLNDFKEKIEKCLKENFKKKNKKKITGSIKKFSEDIQEKRFVNEIEKYVKS